MLTDAVLNEFRYLDENNTVPLIVPLTSNETFVVALVFEIGIGASDPSVVRDTDGNQSGRNGLYAQIGGSSYAWFNSSSLGVNGDWVIRAVIDCAVVAQQADVGVGIAASPLQYTAGQPLSYTIVIDNAGPLAAPSNTIVDIFPAAFQSPAWTCSASAGASCPASGSGNITNVVGLPVGGQVPFSVSGTVAPGTTGTLVNSVTAVVGGGVTDPIAGNNTATANTDAAGAVLLFLDGCEG